MCARTCVLPLSRTRYWRARTSMRKRAAQRAARKRAKMRSRAAEVSSGSATIAASFAPPLREALLRRRGKVASHGPPRERTGTLGNPTVLGAAPRGEAEEALEAAPSTRSASRECEGLQTPAQPDRGTLRFSKDRRNASKMWESGVGIPTNRGNPALRCSASYGGQPSPRPRLASRRL